MVEMLIVLSLSLPIFAALFMLPILMVARSVTDYALPAVKEDKTKPVLVSKLLIYFAFYAFGIAMTEPAMGDWLVVFMSKILWLHQPLQVLTTQCFRCQWHWDGFRRIC